MDEVTFKKLVEDVQHLAASDGTLVEMFKHIQCETGKVDATFDVFRVFWAAFDVPLHEISCLGAWNGFKNGNPGETGESLETEFGDRIRSSIRGAH